MALTAVGLNFWAVTVVVPVVLAGPKSLWVGAAIAAPLPFLGVAIYRRDPISVLALYPFALVTSLAMLPSLTLGHPHPPLLRLVAAVSLLAYGAVGARAVTRPSFEQTASKALRLTVSEPEAERRRRGRRWLLSVGGLGLLLVAVLGPSLGGAAALRRDWGTSAQAAEVLTAVIAGAIATIGAAAFLGPATRRRRQPISERRRRTRVGLLMMVVVFGAFVWMTLRRHQGG